MRKRVWLHGGYLGAPIISECDTDMKPFIRPVKSPLKQSLKPCYLAASITLASLVVSLDAGAIPAQSWNQGTYIWDSQTLLEPEQRQHALNQLQAQGMKELLVGLTGTQVKQGLKTETALRELVQAAKARQLKVSLLLGDPSWIEPEGRQELIALIKRYQSVPFNGLHLDLEVEQLGWPVPTQRLQQWVHTLKEAKQASPWPVSISSHPRWFERSCNERDANSQVCIPRLLSGIHSVSLMMYQRNPKRITQRSLAIANRWPQLRFRLAQSVEAQLSREESWHGLPASKLQTQVAEWRQTLGGAGIKGVDWQDWAQYPKEN
jgi:hypothetical protein